MAFEKRSYINVPRIAARLECLRSLQPEYYALSAMVGESRVGLTDESSGYILGRRLLLRLRSSHWVWRPSCDVHHPIHTLSILGNDITYDGITPYFSHFQSSFLSKSFSDFISTP